MMKILLALFVLFFSSSLFGEVYLYGHSSHKCSEYVIEFEKNKNTYFKVINDGRGSAEDIASSLELFRYYEVSLAFASTTSFERGVRYKDIDPIIVTIQLNDFCSKKPNTGFLFAVYNVFVNENYIIYD